MTCAEFREWLKIMTQTGVAEGETARRHADFCPACARLLSLDQAAEQALRASLVRVEAPAGLAASVKMIAGESRKERRSWVRFWLAMPGAALALLLLLVFHPLDRSLSSIEQIARLAEKSHFAGYTMQFRAGEVSDLAGWFRDKLDFEIAPPELAHRGLEFLGGRKCTLGGKDVAYLFFEQDGKRFSLFQLDAGDVKIDLEEGQTYRYPIHDCVVELWKEGNRVFVLIV